MKSVLFTSLFAHVAAAFLGSDYSSIRPHTRRITPSSLKLNNNKKVSRYEDDSGGAAASKGIVSSLTNLVNLFSFAPPSPRRESTLLRNETAMSPPQSPQELLERIRQDYTVRNYLWTGDIDLSSFDEQCKFTDPTLSFTGTNKFVENIRNLRPLVEALFRRGKCRSDLLEIELYEEEGYVQSRWKMVGELNVLPWKPKIDVIGRTKFWYKQQQDEQEDLACRVFFYDEEWEIPPGRALLQLVTPAGTIPNTGTGTNA